MLAPNSFRKSALVRFKKIQPKVKQPHPPIAVVGQGLGFPQDAGEALNILFRYMYRDASNYKLHGEAIFTNHTFLVPDEIEKQIRACLSEGKYFIARQVHIEERFFDALHDDDHPWHEFEGVEATTLAAFDPDNWTEFQHRRDISEFIAELEKAHTAGWDEMNVRQDVKGLLERQKLKLKQKPDGEPPC